MVVGLLKSVAFIIPDIPQTVQIAITNKCNLDCKMCPRTVLGVKFEHMTLNVYKKVINNLKGVSQVRLTGWGEPLLHPQLKKMIKIAKENGHTTTLITNGLLLTEAIQKEIIDVGLDDIVFSVDSIDGIDVAHSNAKSLKNIKSFISKKSPTTTSINSTIHKGELQSVLDVISFAAKVGIPSVFLLRLGIQFDKTLKRANQEEEKQIFEKAEKLGESLGVRVDFPPIRTGVGKDRKLYNYFKGMHYGFRNHCPVTYDSSYVTIDGTTTPCCLLTRQITGDLKKDNIKTIWRSDKFKKFRKNQVSFCDICDIYQLKF